MGLFSKKDEEKKLPRPMLKIEDLPEFPEMPSSEQELPAYKASLSDIKEEVEKSDDYLDIPKRAPVRRELQRFNAPVQDFVQDEKADFTPKVARNTGKPLFVKIDQYKAALTAIDLLKHKITEAEVCLKDIENIRSKEDAKLEEWKADIQKLKEKLLEIDENLFEV